MSIEETLAERGARYGDFTDHAQVAQHLQNAMRNAPNDRWEKLTPDKRQALTVIADKIARILTGDPEYKDNWHDIQGYAKLAEDRCAEAKPQGGAWDDYHATKIAGGDYSKADDQFIVADEKIEWHGWRMPVYPATTVEVHFRNGQNETGEAENFRWHHKGRPDDIIAYRVLPEQFAN